MDKVKVFYVEDEPFLAQIVKESLETRGFDVHLVNDGALAVEAFNSIQPDICVLDVMLPHKDGFSLAKDIKQTHPQTPIIFLTAKIQTEDLIEGFASGGNDYLRKPFSIEELIARIYNLLNIVFKRDMRPTPKPTQQKISLGKYVYYPGLYELHLEQKVRNLSNRENRLLQLLTNDLDTTVLRHDILMSIWGNDSHYNSRNLDVYISKLRDYFAEDSTIQINTIKGVGYHFRC